MTKLKALAVLVSLFGVYGCSETTQQETKEALQQSGDAVESAAKDTAENTKKAAEKVEETLDPDGE